jgi:hypothetical protein
MPYHSAELFRSARQRFNEHCPADSQAAGERQREFYRRTVFLYETNTGEGIQFRGIQAVEDA